jgi:exo-1,4-beta-D-glucosaminidase
VLDYPNSVWYQTPVTEYADLQGLRDLPRGNVSVKASSEHVDGDTMATTITVTSDPGNRSVAFFVRASVQRSSDGELVLPVTWSDNYISLWPGETATLRAEYRAADLNGATPVVGISGWNVPAAQISAD